MRIGLPGDEIVDFIPVGNNRIMFLSKEGVISYHEFSLDRATQTRINKKFRLDIPSDEFCYTMSVCPKAKFAAVATYEQFKNNRLMSNVHFLAIDDNDNFVLLDKMNLSNMPFSSEDGSFASIISMDFYHGEYPLLVVAQYASDGLMLTYWFDGKRLRKYKEEITLHNNIARRMVRIGSMLYSIDYNGNISRIKF